MRDFAVGDQVAFLVGHIGLPFELRSKAHELGQWNYVWKVAAHQNFYGIEVLALQRGEEITLADADWCINTKYAQGTVAWFPFIAGGG